MCLLHLPDDVLGDIMEYGQLHPLSLVCKRLYSIWHTVNVCMLEDLSGSPVLPPCMTQAMAGAVRNFRYIGDRLSWHPLMSSMRPRTVALNINNWYERWNICKIVSWCQPCVERLVLHSAACSVPYNTMAALCAQISQVKDLRCLEIRILHGHLNDASLKEMGHLATQLNQLHRLSLVIPMNSITICGLQRFMDAITTLKSIQEVFIDVSGNWIRGPEYGKQLARFAAVQSLRSLHLTFGGWGVRKQFGLEYLMFLGSHTNLQSVSITIVGARITCEFFKKAMQGISVLPHLRDLKLDFRSSDVGDQCHRGLSLLRSAKRLERLQICLGHPSERLLSAIGAIQHSPSLTDFALIIDQRAQMFNLQHARHLAAFTNTHCKVQISIQNTKLPHVASLVHILTSGFLGVPAVCVRLTDHATEENDIVISRGTI